MFAVERLMLPSGSMIMVPDCAFAGRSVNAQTNKLKNNNDTMILEAVLLNLPDHLNRI
jgi:hypothetical protein